MNNRKRLNLLLEGRKYGILEDEEYKKELNNLSLKAGRQDWKNYIDKMFLILGILFITSGIIFFFAFNWKIIPRYFKFGSIMLFLSSGVVLYNYFGHQRFLAKLCLFFSIMMTGVLLAVIGQVYQTGADSYVLFLLWSLFIIPWVIISDFSSIWIFWYVLVEITCMLFLSQHRFEMENLVYIALTNVVFYFFFEYIRTKINDSRVNNLLSSFITFMTYFFLTIISVAYILDFKYMVKSDLLPLFTPIIYGGFSYLVYKISEKKKNMVALTIQLFSYSLLVLAVAIRMISEINDRTFISLVFTMIILGEGILFTKILKKIKAKWGI